ncbi:MAG TPA: nitroreductase family protein [Phycisphaerae bacterium]|nr:nitroreductase family protein [Phycisphaerae bacterium]
MEAEGKDTGKNRGEMNRRRFCKVAAAGLGGLAFGDLGIQVARAGERTALLPPIVTGHSAEICMNSRVARHSGLTGTATSQQIANILWAAGRAPVTGSYRTIYFKDHTGTYIYDPVGHSIEYYSSGTVTNAFRINYDRERDFDAGVSYVLALWASVSLWTGTSNQVASCPQQSDLNFGINSVPGLTSQLVAISSDGSLPNPVTDGPNHLEEVLAGLRLRTGLRTDLNLSLQRLSQILWAGYGCTAHAASSGQAGLTVPSWMAGYFLTNRIYVVNDRVWRYCDRIGSSLTTRDHRLELVQNADVRNALRQALPDLAPAPCYILLCLTQTGLSTWYYRLEAGMAAGGMLLESEALGLGCNFKAALSSAEQTAVKQITQIPAADYPHAVVAVGHRLGDVDGQGGVNQADVDDFVNVLVGQDVDPGHVAGADVNLSGRADGLDVEPFLKLLVEP